MSENKNIIVLFENGNSLILEENSMEILNDILRDHKNIKIYKADKMDISLESKKEVKKDIKKEEKNKKFITIYFQNGVELELEDPTDEMIAEIIEKFDNAIIVEKPDSSKKLSSPSAVDDILGLYDTYSEVKKENTSTKNKDLEDLFGLFDFSANAKTNEPVKVAETVPKEEKKITKKEVREALMKPGTPVGGQVLPPFALFTLYHSLKD